MNAAIEASRQILSQKFVRSHTASHDYSHKPFGFRRLDSAANQGIDDRTLKRCRDVGPA